MHYKAASCNHRDRSPEWFQAGVAEGLWPCCLAPLWSYPAWNICNTILICCVLGRVFVFCLFIFYWNRVMQGKQRPASKCPPKDDICHHRFTLTNLTICWSKMDFLLWQQWRWRSANVCDGTHNCDTSSCSQRTKTNFYNRRCRCNMNIHFSFWITNESSSPHLNEASSPRVSPGGWTGLVITLQQQDFIGKGFHSYSSL